MAIKRISVLEHLPYQPNVLGYVDALPTTNSVGDRYILSTTQNINTWYDDAWIEDTPEEGWRCTVLNNGEPFDLKFTAGEWVIVEDVYDSEELPTEELPTEEFEQVQSDWEEEDTLLPSYIKNKPTIPSTTDFGVMSVTGDGVDNTDPANPVINFPDLTPYLTEVNWGDIGGDLSNQTDLVEALTLKEDVFILTLSELNLYLGTPKNYVLITNADIYGLFRYDPAISDPPDDITIIQDGNGVLYKRVNNKIYPRYFGARGDGVLNTTTGVISGTDDTDAIQDFLSYRSRGELDFENKNYRIDGILYINGVNGTSGNLELDNSNPSSLIINGNGARLITAYYNTSPILKIDSSKRIHINNLQIDGDTEINGLWESSFKNVYFHNLAINNNPLTALDEFYYNHLDKCVIARLDIYTGTMVAKTEVNHNLFSMCKIGYGVVIATSPIRIYGSANAQSNTFNACDIYPPDNTSVVYVNETVNDVSLIFSGGTYIDRGSNLSDDLKNVKIVVDGIVNNPSESNWKKFNMEDASFINVNAYNTTNRAAKRQASSGLNLIKNGNFKYSTQGINLVEFGMTVTTPTGGGVYGNYLHAESSQIFRTIQFESIPVPFDGWYSCVVIGKINSGSCEITTRDGNGVATTSNPIILDSTLSTDSFIIKLDKGEIFRLRMLQATATALNMDIHYVGLTYGVAAPLIESTLHPDADYEPTIYSFNNPMSLPHQLLRQGVSDLEVVDRVTVKGKYLLSQVLSGTSYTTQFVSPTTDYITVEAAKSLLGNPSPSTSQRAKEITLHESLKINTAIAPALSTLEVEYSPKVKKSSISTNTYQDFDDTLHTGYLSWHDAVWNSAGIPKPSNSPIADAEAYGGLLSLGNTDWSYSLQLYYQHSTGGRLHYRTSETSATWTAWKTLATLDDISAGGTYVNPLDGIGQFIIGGASGVQTKFNAVSITSIKNVITQTNDSGTPYTTWTEFKFKYLADTPYSYSNSSFLRSTTTGLEWRTPAQVKSDIGAIGSLFEDTTPELYFNLDANGNTIYELKNIYFLDEYNMGTATQINTGNGAYQYRNITGNTTFTFSAASGYVNRTQVRFKLSISNPVISFTGVIFPNGKPDFDNAASGQEIIITFVYTTITISSVTTTRVIAIASSFYTP